MLESVQIRPLLAPLNAGTGGYREAGEWLAHNAEPGDRVQERIFHP